MCAVNRVPTVIPNPRKSLNLKKNLLIFFNFFKRCICSDCAFSYNAKLLITLLFRDYSIIQSLNLY